MLPYSFANAVQGGGASSSTHNVHHDEHVSQPNSVENNSHPLFFHNNDHPGLVLIAKKLVGSENYAPWSRSMQVALNARNKFVIINGSFAQPDDDSVLFT